MEDDAPIPVGSHERDRHLESRVTQLALELHDKGYTTEEISAAYLHRLNELQRAVAARRAREG